ncbi:hypothetical protein ACTXT7_009453 [Hymenolepis weldensis]
MSHIITLARGIPRAKWGLDAISLLIEFSRIFQTGVNALIKITKTTAIEEDETTDSRIAKVQSEHIFEFPIN